MSRAPGRCCARSRVASPCAQQHSSAALCKHSAARRGRPRPPTLFSCDCERLRQKPANPFRRPHKPKNPRQDAPGATIAPALIPGPHPVSEGNITSSAAPAHAKNPRLHAIARAAQNAPLGKKFASRGVPPSFPALQPLTASRKNAFVYDEGASVAYQDKETNLHYNYYRDYDPAIGRYIQSDPIGLLGGVNTYAYVGSNPVGVTDPLGLCPCAGGVWDQEIGDFQINVGAGGYVSVGNVNYTCRSNPSLKCSGKQVCLGASTPNLGVSWALGGVQFGANDSNDLSGWSGSGVFSGWNLGAQGGIVQGQISLSGQGGGTAVGLPRGVSAGLFKCLNYYMKCNCPTCPSQ